MSLSHFNAYSCIYHDTVCDVSPLMYEMKNDLRSHRQWYNCLSSCPRYSLSSRQLLLCANLLLYSDIPLNVIIMLNSVLITSLSMLLRREDLVRMSLYCVLIKLTSCCNMTSGSIDSFDRQLLLIFFYVTYRDDFLSLKYIPYHMSRVKGSYALSV